jgi:hypothetical protein
MSGANAIAVRGFGGVESPVGVMQKFLDITTREVSA